MKKEYTRTIQYTWQPFYDHDEKRINLIKKEIILRLNKYCEFHNQRCRQLEKVDDEKIEKKITKKLINEYCLPEKVYLSLDWIIPKSRIRLYERYVRNNYCKGVPAQEGEYELDYDKVPILYMEELDDLDLAYIFFGVPLEANYDLPKPFFEMSWASILYHIERRMNWEEGFKQEFYPNKALAASGSYVNGLRHGLWKIQSPDGKISKHVEWENGVINGIDYQFNFFNSKIGNIEICKNGHYLMSWEHSKDIARITKQRRYARLMEEYDNPPNMLSHPYNELKKRKNGKFKEGNKDWYFEGEYDNNIPAGIWREYLDNKLIYELVYKNGDIDLENSIFRFKKNGNAIPWDKL